jgi:hypothetical protein
MTQYNSVSVKFEHTTDGNDNRRVNRAVLTVYGDSEFADITILECEFR